MSDTSRSEEETEPEEPRAGKRLAEARQAQNISVFDIAKELHLDELKVNALEENEFDVLGAPVFAKAICGNMQSLLVSRWRTSWPIIIY